MQKRAFFCFKCLYPGSGQKIPSPQVNVWDLKYVVVSEIKAYYLHGVLRDLSSLEVWRKMTNNYYCRRSELLNFDVSACRPMACAYGASAHHCARCVHSVRTMRILCA